MNKLLDPKIFLTLKETEKGFYLYTNIEKQKLIINNGKIQNNLNERQLDFVKDYIKL